MMMPELRLRQEKPGAEPGHLHDDAWAPPPPGDAWAPPPPGDA